ncbi:DUF4907 domain-containing protein [Aquimarina gracilis]|uniref:DUF4907 domain-containing protein n=1 Tax=Aquimarina gracilis TaxID=874422 RepID=A0ABU5ZYW6_9FLAO|nr:DUF4907 domain-containing protein [Aquimarina gracilis]MEB3347011.1 DUF4907 domain-containing protein [Aquimarina gracilis]
MKKPLKYLLIFGIIMFGVLIGNYFLEEKPEKEFDYYSKYYRVKVKELSDNDYGWYYEIYRGDDLLIKQENIPGVSGNQYFKSNEEAKKIAVLVVAKLERRTMPNITMEELDSCNIDFKK